MIPDMNWAMRQQAPASCKHILLVLANRADRNHSCYPSLTRIAADTGLDRATVKRCITRLLELGLLVREKRGIQTNIYRLSVGAPRTQQQAQDEPRRTTPLGAPRALGGRTMRSKVGAPCATEPLEEPKRTVRGGGEAPVGVGEFYSVVLTDAQSKKLEARLNGNFQNYVNRLDRYSQTHPKKFKEYKSHYAVILGWFDRDVEEGKVKPEGSGKYTPEQIAEATARLKAGGALR